MARSTIAASALAAALLLLAAAASAQDPSASPPKQATGCTARFSPEAATRPPAGFDKGALVKETMARVAEAKRALEEALSSDAGGDAAWKAHCANVGKPEMYYDDMRREVFFNNLLDMQARNKEEGDDMVAWGITQRPAMRSLPLPANLPRRAKPAPRRVAEDPSTGEKDPSNPFNGGRKLLQGALTCRKNRAYAGAAGALPSYFDWRTAGVITPVRNQLGCGSCSAFATVGALESTWIRKWWGLGYRSYNTDLSEDDFLECTAGNQCGGAWPDSVFDRFTCRGAPFEAAQPYNAADGNVCRDIPRYNTGAAAWSYVPAAGVPTTTDILARSVRLNPTVIAVDASAWSGLAAGWVSNCGARYTALNHAVLVVGWIDDVPMSNGETWDYWLIKNSWGTGFANAGYAWVRKDCAASPGPFGMYRMHAWTPSM
ncbi:hypothetical protein HT031_002752 [Scenedesmus sp. PABB004]|nr:hypothetical protein HT031_002752 [Scenedesmus sp. PABB004]